MKHHLYTVKYRRDALVRTQSLVVAKTEKHQPLVHLKRVVDVLPLNLVAVKMVIVILV